ncbi:PD-(D/E)XK nuclease-like domain-containing protein [Streptacidiphilus cavernicola]|uniref:PD-(D/E)XK nuclease-like domain-containing protein n=1 Tax=Streptacidiphilus cavernicola TaxID=3342716 RepID=A0ABV6W475_9ACTN
MTAILDAPTQLQVDGFAPGVHQMDAETYHAQRDVLSSSGARLLINPSCPAKFRWAMDNPQPPKKTFDYGTAAHRMVLGDGPELVLVDAKLWNTDKIRAEVAAIRAEGNVPLKRDEMQMVKDMAAAIRQHPVASKLFDPDSGKPEQSLFWQDKATGVQCRARLDWLRHADGGRLICPDYKSAADASTKAFNWAVQDYRYHQQAEFYKDGIRALGLAEDVPFLFVVQEKSAPYLINIIELDPLWLLMAVDRNKRARETFARCMETGEWAGYPNEIQMVSPPAWLETEHEREYS